MGPRPHPSTLTAWDLALTPRRAQVIYHFISGYTSKMAGTEEGITKPVATFSACYGEPSSCATLWGPTLRPRRTPLTGEPFLVWHPVTYATMLAERLEKHEAHAWLVRAPSPHAPLSLSARSAHCTRVLPLRVSAMCLPTPPHTPPPRALHVRS